MKQFEESGEVEIILCPTEQMIADLMTQSVVGAKF